MCSRIDQDGNVINFVKKFSKSVTALKPRYNIGIGAPAAFINNQYQTTEGIFGFVPKWAKEVKQVYYNARTEGKNNDSNDTNFTGEMGIFEMPSFRDAIKTSRCIIPVSAFYEGPEVEGLKKPFKIFSNTEPVLYLAGIFGNHFDPKKEKDIMRFSILTTPAIPATAAIGHHRCPLMLNEEYIETWLDADTSREDLEEMMKGKWQPLLMSSAAIDPAAIKIRESELPPALANSLF